MNCLFFRAIHKLKQIAQKFLLSRRNIFLSKDLAEMATSTSSVHSHSQLHATDRLCDSQTWNNSNTMKRNASDAISFDFYDGVFLCIFHGLFFGKSKSHHKNEIPNFLFGLSRSDQYFMCRQNLDERKMYFRVTHMIHVKISNTISQAKRTK